MAAPLVQQVVIDQATAQRQIAELERQLAQLNTPIDIPVDIETGDAVDGLRRDVSQADAGFEELNSEIEETERELKRAGEQSERTGRSIEDAGRRGTSAFKGFTASAVGFFGAIAAFQGFQALGRGAFDAIQQASNLEESLSKTNVVFEEFSGQIQEFADTAPEALGLSTAAALEATSTFGNLFVALGLTQEEAATLSPELIQLASDLASFNNINVGDAIEKLRSGLVGESEPLRTLGVNINETVVAAKALELGLGGVTGELTEAEKVQARYALIMEQTTTAQGDFARTADGVANTQRTLTAEWENAQAAIGEALLPAFASLLDVMPSLITAFEQLAPTLQSIAQTVAETDFTGLIEGAVDLSKAFLNLPSVFVDILSDESKVSDGMLDITRLTQGFIDLLRAGEDPAKALLNSLVQLEGKDLRPEQFTETAQAFISMARLDPSRLRDTIRELRLVGPSLGLAAPEIEAIARELALANAQFVISPEAIRATAEQASALAQTTPGLSEVATAIRDIAVAGGDLSEFSLDLGAEGFESDMDDIVTAFDGARQALKTDEGQIVADLDTFLANLDQVFTDQLSFERNIAILRDRGLNQLADLFEDAGLEAASALADAVSDPTASARAQAAIEQQARDLANADFIAFQTEINKAIAGYDAPAVIIPLAFGALPTFPQFTGSMQFPATGTAAPPPVQVTNNFFTEPQPTSDTTRVTQATGSINRSRTGGAVSGIG